MYRIIEGIYGVEGLRVGRVYVIERANGLTLIDTSVAKSLPQIRKELATIGHALDEIKHIVITHAHPDHFGSLKDLKATTGAQSYAHHRYESAVIRGEKPIIRPRPTQLHGISRLIASQMPPIEVIPATIDVELKEGDRLDDILPGLEVIDSPGHSPGHCSLWYPKERLLFAGDAIVRVPLNLGVPPAVVTPDMEEAKRSIRKLAELGIDTLCMGHGKPYIGDARPALAQFVGKLS